MTDEQILKLAKTCGFNSGNVGATYWECWERQLLKFAQAIYENGYNNGYGECSFDAGVEKCMTEQNPITPPPELFRQWEHLPRSLAFESAYRAGADAELEACCEWVENECPGYGRPYEKLRSARRPKPLSLKEQALSELNLTADPNGAELSRTQVELIRRALEQFK